MKTKTRAARKTKGTRIEKRVAKGLQELARVELVRSSLDSVNEPVYWFKHALVQDTALSTLLRGEYKRLNSLVAHALEDVNARRLDEYAAQLAQHFAAAEDNEKTLAYATRAGDRALRVYATTEAVAFYTMALDAAKQSHATNAQWLHLYKQRGRAYELSAQYDAALANYDALEQLAQQRGDRALQLQALMARLPIFATPTSKYDPPQAEALANEALTLAREIGDRAAEAKTLWLRMLTMVRSLRPQEGIPDGEAALVIARELNLREQMAYTLHDLSSSYAGVGQFERAQRLGMEARELWRELDNKPMLADNLSSMANGLIFLGELDQVIALSDEAFQISQSIGNLWGQAYSLAMVGQAHEERGDYARALTAMRDGICYAERAGFFVPQVQTRTMLAEAYEHIGAFELARRVAQQALDLQINSSAAVHPVTIPLRVRAYLILNDMDHAQAALASARAWLQSMGAVPGFFELILTYSQVQLGMAREEFANTLELLEGLIQELRAYGIFLFLPVTLFQKSQALLQIGERDAAYYTLQEADTAAQQIGSRRMRWQILASMSDIEHARGNRARAEQLRNEARAILDYILAKMPQEFHASFLNLPTVRAVMSAPTFDPAFHSGQAV